MGATAGAVISASHNPAAENGIKFLSAEGMKLTPPEQEGAIEANIASLTDEVPGLEGEYLGEHSPKLFEVYLQDILATVPGLDLNKLRILLDCSNGGAAWKAAPEVLRRLGADLVVINTECDGANINLHAGSENLRSRPEELAKILKAEKADLAIALTATRTGSS